MAAPKGHKYSVGNNGGRPPLYESAEDLILAIDDYFIYIQGESHEEYETIEDKENGGFKEVAFTVVDRYPEPATITGLALFLGFSSRQSLFDYEKNEKFSYVIRKARTWIEHEYEKRLASDKPTGSIFALKNMGWQDKTEVMSVNFNTEITKEEAKNISDALENEV